MSVENLNFQKNVSATGEGAALPSYTRKEGVAVTPNPNLQSAVSNYASSTNWMSAIGSTVAAQASNSLAVKLGTELGKNPKGNIGIPLTEFDSVMHKSYIAQSQATLGLQANRLISQSNIEMAQSPRITPDLIQKTNKSISIGLQNIFKNAPDEARSDLEYRFGNLQVSQLEQLTNRMIGEQKEDQKNTIMTSSQTNAENAHSLALQGNAKAAKAYVDATILNNQSGAAAHVINPQTAKVNIDTARQSYKSGLKIAEYEKARLEHKETQVLKDQAEKADKSDPDYDAVTSNLLQHVQQQNTLRNYNDSLVMAKFQTDLASGVPIPGSRLSELEDTLSPINYQKTMLQYFSALKKNQESQQEQALLNNGFNNPDVWARTSDDAKNKAFDDKVRYIVDSSKNSDHQIGIDEAEAGVAAQAAGPITAFTNVVNSKLKSIDPNQVESGMRQIESVHQAEKGANLTGVDDKALARGELYNIYKKSMPAQNAAQLSYDQVYNIKDEQYKVLESKWKDVYKNVIGANNSTAYYGKIAGINVSELSDPLGFQSQADMLFHGYFLATHGNMEAAQKMFTRDINSQYGETYANGSKQVSYLPIEKMLGLPTNATQLKFDKSNVPLAAKGITKEFEFLFNHVFNRTQPYSAVGVLQEDIINNVTQQLAPVKEAYDKGQSLSYFEIESRPSLEHAKQNKRSLNTAMKGTDNLRLYSNGSPIIIHQVYKNGTRDTYELQVKSNPYLTTLGNGAGYAGGYDVVLVSGKTGYQNLGLLTPFNNRNIIYKPDVQKIRERYLKGYANER